MTLFVWIDILRDQGGKVSIRGGKLIPNSSPISIIFPLDVLRD